MPFWGRGGKHLYSIVFSPRFSKIFSENEMPCHFTLFTLFTLVYTSKTPSVNAVTLIHYTLQQSVYVFTLKPQYFSSLDYFFRGEKCIGDFYAASCLWCILHLLGPVFRQSAKLLQKIHSPWLTSKIVKTGVSFYYLCVYERANKTPPYQARQPIK